MLLTLVRLALKLVAAALAVAIPLLAVWVASSLAAYRNGPVWLACLCGLLLFPIVPLLWEALGRWRTRRARNLRARVLRSEALRPHDGLTFADRLILRTLVVSLVFLTALVLRHPQTTFAALSTRGDWFLDGREGPTVDRVRAGLFTAADRLQWLYQALRDNPFDDLVEPAHETTPPPAPEASTAPPLPQRQPDPTPDARTDPTPDARTDPTPDTPTPDRAADGRPVWPLAAALHPLVTGIPAEHEASIASVARYIADREPDKWQRIKALHDYVADRVAYDVEAYNTRNIPPQDAELVFKEHRGVCAGYANLLAALGDAAGEQIVVVVGDARTESSDLTGEGHAWNAAQIDGAWYLIDPTWDAGHVRGSTFTKNYQTGNLFTPPNIFAISHFPDETRWQLQDPPVSRGDFFRQPVMRPSFFAAGLELVSPTRSQIDTDGDFEARIRHTSDAYFLMANVRDKAGAGDLDCTVAVEADTSRVTCPLRVPGTYQVILFGSPVEYGTYTSIGSFEVHRAG